MDCSVDKGWPRRSEGPCPRSPSGESQADLLPKHPWLPSRHLPVQMANGSIETPAQLRGEERPGRGERGESLSLATHTQAELDQNNRLAKGLAPETPSYPSFQLPKGFPRYFSVSRAGTTSPPHPSCFHLALGVEHLYTGSGVTDLLQSWPVGQDMYTLS